MSPDTKQSSVTESSQFVRAVARVRRIGHSAVAFVADAGTKSATGSVLQSVASLCRQSTIYRGFSSEPRESPRYVVIYPHWVNSMVSFGKTVWQRSAVSKAGQFFVDEPSRAVRLCVLPALGVRLLLLVLFGAVTQSSVMFHILGMLMVLFATSPKIRYLKVKDSTAVQLLLGMVAPPDDREADR